MRRPVVIAAPAVVVVPAVFVAFWLFGSGGGGQGGEPPAVLLPPDPAVGAGEEVAFISPPPPPDCGPDVSAEFLEQNQIVSYYGNPYVPAMGILGELEPEELIARVKAHAEKYDALNGARGVQPALHMVYASAQPEPGPDGLHLIFVDRRTVNQYINLACKHGFLVFLDVQLGRSDVATEVTDMLTYLQLPHVHASLDPEFAMPPGEIPGESIGTLDAADINEAQRILEAFALERGLPDKMLIVHQFTDGMVTRPELIEDYARVRLVIDMDGFGPAEIKQVKFGWYAAAAEYSGIKLFFKQDAELMSEEEVLELEPDVIIHQ